MSHFKSLLAAAALAVAPTALAHAGCDSYQHGHNLFARDPAMADYEASLAKRYPGANGRVLSGADLQAELARRDLNRRQQQSSSKSLPAEVTSVDSSAVEGIVSGTDYSKSLSVSPLPTTYQAGEDSPIKGAPALPAAQIVVADYPALDKPVENAADDPNVKIWMSQIDTDGIPDWDPTGDGGCANKTVNQDAIDEAGEDGRCWWTCGGCVRNTDVTFCPDKQTWGLSYDDGPAPYTPKLLDYLDEAELKTTFFVVGSRVISRPDILQYEYMAGHQIAVHTWSHFSLTTLTNEEIVAEFGYSKKAIQEVLGVTPKYMRPPYGDIDDRVRYIAMQMGLTPIIWTRYQGQTFDTQDWQIEGGVVNTSTVIENFDDILAKAPEMDNGFIVLEHDLYPQSVQLAVEYVLPNALAKGELDLMPIIDCLGMDHSEAYIETAQNATSGLVPTTAIVGASASGMVTGLTYTPVALGGGITQSGDSTLGYSAEESASAGSGGNKKSNKDNSNADDSDSDSSASAPIASLSLLLAVAFGSLGLWA